MPLSLPCGRRFLTIGHHKRRCGRNGRRARSLKMLCFPRLVVLKTEGATGSIFPFPSGRCSLGGLPSCDIRIPSAGKSHCLVVVDKNNQAHIINVDAPSVQLNGVPVENEAFVNHKDLIQFAAKSFRFEWVSKRKRGVGDSAEVPADEGAMGESSTLENGAGDQLCAHQESHGTPESHGTRGPHVTPGASSSSASFLDQSVYKTPHIPPEEFVSPLTASGSNYSGCQSQGANRSKGSLKHGAVKGAGQSANSFKRLSWSDTPQRSDQEPAEIRSQSRGPNSSLFVTPSQGVHAEDQDDEEAGGRVSDYLPIFDYMPSTTSTPLVDEPRMRAVRSQSSLVNGEGLSGGRVSDCVPSTTSTPLIDEPRMRAVRSQSSLTNGGGKHSKKHGRETVSLSDSTLSMSSSTISISSDSDAPELDSSPSRDYYVTFALGCSPEKHYVNYADQNCIISAPEECLPNNPEYVLPDMSEGFLGAVPPRRASSSSPIGAKKQRALHRSRTKKSVRGRSSVPRSCSDSSSGEDKKLQDPARPSTSKGISAAGTPVVPPPRGAGQLPNGAKTRSRNSSHRTNPNTTISEGPDSSQSFFDTSAGSSEVLSFADGHSSSATSLRTPRPNVPRKSSNVSGGSVGYRSLRKASKQSLGSGNVNKLDPNEATPPDAPGSPADGKATSQNHAQNGQAIEAKVPGSLEQDIDISSVSTPRIQRKGRATRLATKSSLGCDEQAQRGSRASCTPSVKGREVEAPARKGHKEDDSFEYKNVSPKLCRSSRADSSKKSPGGLEELGSPSSSSKISRAHALTETNGWKEATHQEVAQRSFRSTRSGSLAGSSTAVEKGDSSQHEVDSPAKTPTTGPVPTPEDFSRSPVVTLELIVIPARSGMPLLTKANENVLAKGDRKSLSGAAAAKKKGTWNGFDEACGVSRTASPMELFHDENDSVTSKKNTKASSTPASTSVNEADALKLEAVEKSFGGRSCGKSASKAHGDAEASQQEVTDVPIKTPKANHKENPSHRSSRGSRTSASHEDKPEAEEKDTAVKRSRGSSTGARASSRPEDEAREQDTSGVEKPLASSAVARSSRGGRTPTSTNDGTQCKGTVDKSARESSAGRRAASKRALEDSDNSEQGSASLPATTPKTKHHQSFETLSDSPVAARSSRGSRRSASRDQEPGAEEKDTVVKRSRRSSTGARASSRPEEDEAREQDTAGVEKPLDSSAVSRSSRGGRTPTSTNDGTRGAGTVDKSARESSAGRRAASKRALEDSDNPEQGSASLPVTAPKTERQQSFEGPSVTPVNARSTRGSRTPASQEQTTVGERSRVSTAPKNRPEDKAQGGTTTVPAKTSVAELVTPSTSTQETGRETVQQEIGPRGSRRSQAGHTRALNVTEEDETSEQVNVAEKTPKTGHQQIKKDGAASSTKSKSQGDHLNITVSSTAESPKAVPQNRGSRGANTPAPKDTCSEDEASQHDIGDVAAKTFQASKNKSEKDASVSTAQSLKTEHPARSSRATRISASANVSEDCDLQNTASTSQSLKAEQPSRSSRASRGSSSKEESEKRALQSDASSAQSPKIEQESKMGSPVKSRTSNGGHMPASKKQSGENIAINQEIGCMRQKSVATPTFNEVRGENPEPSPGAARISSTPALKRASQVSGTPRSEKEQTHIVGKDPCSSSQALNQEPQKSDAKTEQPADSVSKQRRPRHEKSADAEPGLVDNAERMETRTSAKKYQKAVATVPFENEQVPNELEVLEAAQSSVQSRAKRATASRKQTFFADQHSDSFPSKEAAAPDKRQQDEADAAHEVTAPRKTRGKRALESQFEASENQLNMEGNTASVPAKSKRGGRTAASASVLNVDQEGSSMDATKVTQTAAPESELKAKEKTASTSAKKKRGGRRAAAASSLGDQDDTVDDLPGAKMRAKQAAASEIQLNTEQSTVNVPERKKRGGRVAASTSGPKTGQNDTAEGSSLGKTTQASGNELNSAEDATDVLAKKKRGGPVAASTLGPKADQDHMAEGETTQASGSELNAAKDTADAPAKRKRGGRVAAPTSGPKADQVDMADGSSMDKTTVDASDVPAKSKRGGRAAALSGPKTDQVGMVEGPLMGKTTQASGSELNSAEDTADAPAKKKRGVRVAASGPKADQADVAEGKTTQAASGSELNSAENTADAPAKRKRGGRAAAATQGPAEGSSTGQTKVLREAAAGTSTRATRAARQKKAPEAETETVPGEHQGGQASEGEGEKAITSSTLGRSRRKGAAATSESLPPIPSTQSKTRGRRAKALDTIVDEGKTGEPAAGSPVAVTEQRGSKRATRRKV